MGETLAEKTVGIPQVREAIRPGALGDRALPS